MNGKKIKVLNLESGYPTADTAVRNMTNYLLTCKRQRIRAVVLIHGYGSSGSGGKIKRAVTAKLKDPSLVGVVRASCPGELWLDKKSTMLGLCPALKEYEVKISGNNGVTAVLLK
ncbi:MAG TPA: Smr/MutS family protein [Anaerovoracaceae bacterium]|nr:Smr/MutS family protein [Anaerovoracaceae bacterium]